MMPLYIELMEISAHINFPLSAQHRLGYSWLVAYQCSNGRAQEWGINFETICHHKIYSIICVLRIDDEKYYRPSWTAVWPLTSLLLIVTRSIWLELSDTRQMAITFLFNIEGRGLTNA